MDNLRAHLRPPPRHFHSGDSRRDGDARRRQEVDHLRSHFWSHHRGGDNFSCTLPHTVDRDSSIRIQSRKIAARAARHRPERNHEKWQQRNPALSAERRRCSD